MPIVSIADNLREMPNPIFLKKKKIYIYIYIYMYKIFQYKCMSFAENFT